jgi:hypothetical protein
MDHDADHTHLTKLKTFRDDFLTLSGITIEQFHEMAEKRRAQIKADGGEGEGHIADKAFPSKGALEPVETHTSAVSPEQHADLADHVKEVSEAVASLQHAQGQYMAILGWLSENQGAIQGLIAGSQAAAHAITNAEGADGASQGENPPASLPEGEAEPLGTDKSTGEVERAGEPLETTTVDAARAADR